VSGKLNFIIGAFIIAVLVGACGGGKSDKASSTKATSTPAATNNLSAYSTEKALPPPTSRPSPTPLIAGPDVRLCHRADITTAVGSGAAESQHLAARIVLGNRTDTPCQIKQPPGVELLDVHGDLSPITVSGPCAACDYFQQPVLLLPGLGQPNANTTLRSGQVALALTWLPHNGAGTCPTLPPKATEVRLLLQDTEDEVVVDVTSAFPGVIAPCDGTVQIFGYGPGTGD
jgi:hypothetical protein